MNVTTALDLPSISAPMVVDIKDLLQHLSEKQALSAMQTRGGTKGVLLQQSEVQTMPLVCGGLAQVSVGYVTIEIAPLHVGCAGGGKEVRILIANNSLQFTAFLFLLPKGR